MWPSISLSTDTVLNAGVCGIKFDLTVITYVDTRYFHFMNEIIVLQNINMGSNRDQKVKTLAAKPDFSPQDHIMEGEDDLLKVSSDMCTVAHPYSMQNKQAL